MFYKSKGGLFKIMEKHTLETVIVYTFQNSEYNRGWIMNDPIIINQEDRKFLNNLGIMI